MTAHTHADHDHHGHQQDRGMRGLLRYMKMLPKMWSSPVSRAVVDEISPRPGEHVVDVGAGMGPATMHAVKTGSTVLAMDPTPYMRGILWLRRLGQRRRGAIRIVDGSAEHIPTGDHSIDALWTVNTMHHWTDLDAAIGELSRVLREGGRLLLVDEDFDDPAHPAFERMKDRHAHRAHHFAAIDPVEVAGKLTAAGFASADGSKAGIAARPAKIVRAVR